MEWDDPPSPDLWESGELLRSLADGAIHQRILKALAEHKELLAELQQLRDDLAVLQAQREAARALVAGIEELQARPDDDSWARVEDRLTRWREA